MNKDLYLTTQEFADLVAKTIIDQGYFKAEDVCHPEDLSSAFIMMSNTIGTTLCWGIDKVRNSPSSDVRYKYDSAY
jgi:hypothetical protein